MRVERLILASKALFTMIGAKTNMSHTELLGSCLSEDLKTSKNIQLIMVRKLAFKSITNPTPSKWLCTNMLKLSIADEDDK